MNIQPINNNQIFGAKVTMDLRCKKYYEKCEAFKNVIDTIKDAVKSDEVNVIADRSAHWSGTRKIFALSQNRNGSFNNWELGEIDTKPMGFYDKEGHINRPEMAFYKSTYIDSRSVTLGEMLNLLLYYEDGESL